MKFSTKGRYALRLMAALACRPAGENISLKEACVALGFLSAEKFDEVFHPEEIV